VTHVVWEAKGKHCAWDRREQLRTIFNLDPDRPEDLPAIAALQASSTRQLNPTRTVAAQRNVQAFVRQLLSRQGRNAA
jgi:hypothetical protein